MHFGISFKEDFFSNFTRDIYFTFESDFAYQMLGIDHMPVICHSRGGLEVRVIGLIEKSI